MVEAKETYYRKEKEERLGKIGHWVLYMGIRGGEDAERFFEGSVSRGIMRGMATEVAEMTDLELLQQITIVSDFTESDLRSENRFGSRDVLKGLQDYAWRRGLVPVRPDWSVESNR